MASSLQSTLLGPESLPLFKLSFCTAATLHSKMTWTHLPHDHSIFAVFDQVRKTGLGGRVSEKKILKLVHGADLFVCLTMYSLQSRLVNLGTCWVLVFLYRCPDFTNSRIRSTLTIWCFKYALTKKECDHKYYKTQTFM